MATTVFSVATTHRELVENLVLRDIKARYKQSTLGYAWAFLNPLILALIYSLVFTILSPNEKVAIPPTVSSYYGLLYWNLFAAGALTATESLVNHLSLITKIYFPREVFPVSAVLSKVVDFGFGLVGLIPLLLIFRVAPSPKILLTLPLMIVLLAFTTGIGLLCACANLFYRDIRYIVNLALGLWVYMVPNIYPLARIPAKWQPLYLGLNPMATLIEASRRLTFPQTGSVIPLLPYVGVAAVASVVLLAGGYVVFKRYEPRFAESI